jgi:hypothetical protein
MFVVLTLASLSLLLQVEAGTAGDTRIDCRCKIGTIQILQFASLTRPFSIFHCGISCIIGFLPAFSEQRKRLSWPTCRMDEA